MNFTCSGKIIKWRAAGELSGQMNDNTKLRIWRKLANQPGFYSSTQLTIALGTCPNNQTVDTINTNVHECELASESQVPVQAGDIVGLEIPRSTRRVFTLYFKKRDGPTNYEFILTPSGNDNLSLSDTSVTRRDTPLLSLTVVIPDTVATTSTNDIIVTTTGSPIDGNTTNNTINIDNDDKSEVLNISIMTVAVFAGLALMSGIIILLILALVCTVRKNRKLKKKMTTNDRTRGLSLGDTGSNINSSMEMILNENTTGHVTSIPMEENIAYNKRRRSDGYEYVINELVYASVEQPNQIQPVESTSQTSNGYLELQA